MKKSEIIYFDVDGTILDEKASEINKTTIDAINKVQENGYKIAIATGRTSGALDTPAIRSICNWDGYILANGGSIMDKEMNIVKEHLCKPEFIKQLITLYPDTIILEGYKNYVVNKMSKNLANFLGDVVESLEVLEEYQDQKILKVIIENFEGIPNGFDNEIFKDYDYHLNTAGMPEIFPKNSGKHIGIREFNEIIGIKRHTYFGDGSNDVDPIREADFGIAMGNASEEAKEAADFVTKGSNEDGVVYALKHFGAL